VQHTFLHETNTFITEASTFGEPRKCCQGGNHGTNKKTKMTCCVFKKCFLHAAAMTAAIHANLTEFRKRLNTFFRIQAGIMWA
jgi:hypothetical protein